MVMSAPVTFAPVTTAVCPVKRRSMMFLLPPLTPPHLSGGVDALRQVPLFPGTDTSPDMTWGAVDGATRLDWPGRKDSGRPGSLA
jgi:hypothetical protein